MMMTGMVGRLWLMSLQACVLILIVLTARHVLKRYPKIYSYLLWILVGIRLLCPVLVESPFSLQPVPARISGVVRELAPDGVRTPGIFPAQGGQEAQPPQMPGAQPAAGNGAASGGPASAAVAGAGETTAAAGGNVDGKGVSAGLWNVLAVIYLAGAAGFAVFYLIQYLMMRRRVSDAVRVKGNVWYCDKITSPFVMGIFRTRIFLPYGLSEQERYYILKHERTHIRHHDPVILLLGILCICLHWWNPLVWLAVHRMNQDMEMFCDEAALKGSQLQDRKAYARTLLAFAAKQNGFAVGLAFGESNTERRVKNLMRRRRRSVIIVFLVVLLAVFCVIALLTVRESESGAQPGGNETQSGESGAQPDGNGTQSGESGAQPDGNETQSGAGQSAAGVQGTSGEPAGDRAAAYAAYRRAMENVIYDKVFPDGAECGVPGTELDPGNYFAVFDIDGDGREELLIQYTTTAMGGMREAVYDYDDGTDTLREELSEFPMITYYANGAVEAEWSHNQGLNAFGGDGFWPYNAYRYDSVTDTYVRIGMVDAWDREVSENNYAGESFPDEVDADSDGILYSIMDTMDRLDAYDALDTLVDGPELVKWQQSYRGDGTQIAIPWQELTVENIHNVLSGGEVFYGRWYVWDYQMAGVSALSAEEAQGYVGTEVVYEENEVRVNGNELPAPNFTYTFAEYTEETLTQEFRINLGEWWNGIPEVVSGDVNTGGNDFGSHFFVVNDETLWIYHEGVFFLARRDKKDTAVG